MESEELENHKTEFSEALVQIQSYVRKDCVNGIKDNMAHCLKTGLDGLNAIALLSWLWKVCHDPGMRIAEKKEQVESLLEDYE